MDRKKYLVEILNRLDIDDQIKIRIRSKLDSLSENQIEKIIAALEKADSRLKNIQLGQVAEVMDEIMDEKIKIKKVETDKKMKQLKADEESEKNKDEKIPEDLLVEIDNIFDSMKT